VKQNLFKDLQTLILEQKKKRNEKKKKKGKKEERIQFVICY